MREDSGDDRELKEVVNNFLPQIFSFQLTSFIFLHSLEHVEEMTKNQSYKVFVMFFLLDRFSACSFDSLGLDDYQKTNDVLFDDKWAISRSMDVFEN